LKLAIEILGYVSLVAYAVLALATIDQWRRRRDRAAAWAAVCFGTLGLVVVIAQAIPDHPRGTFAHWLVRIDLALLLLFPYFLHRFTTIFRAARSRVEQALGLMTVAMLAWTFALPDIPEAGEARPGYFYAYLVGFLIHWTVLSSVASVRLWRAGRGQPSISRRRMRLLAFASATLTVALFVAAATSRTDSVLNLASSALGIVSAIAFMLALTPPWIVRLIWRRPTQARVQDAIRDLMTLATSQEEVAQRVVGPMAEIVGARAVLIRNQDGRQVGSCGLPDDEARPLEHVDHQMFEIEIPSGSLTVWTSPYAPFFGNDELRVLETMGAMTGIALDRVRLFQQEREARLALERADQIKTNFIALASHELRTPVTTIQGLATTLNRIGDRLDNEQRGELREALERQAARMAKLVEQLLDLSRLDAEAIPINPERFNVRERLEDIVASAAADRAGEVKIGAPADLEVSADPTALERIVSNLVTNALRYGSPPVSIEASRTDRHLRIAVRDSGEGVPEKFVPDLFERFTRAAGRDRVSGTGLGLAIARSYARAHDGDLAYEDADPHGACFKLVLRTKPLPAEGSEEAEAEAEVEPHRWRLLRRG
jgi:signal transduction histidine kinase